MDNSAPIALPDVNVLVALSLPSHINHTAAVDWSNKVNKFALTPVTESGLILLLMNPAVSGTRISITDAVGAVEDLRADPDCKFWPDDASFTNPKFPYTAITGCRQVTDFHLLNLAIQNGGVLVTFDRRILAAVPTDVHKHIEIL